MRRIDSKLVQGVVYCTQCDTWTIPEVYTKAKCRPSGCGPHAHQIGRVSYFQDERGTVYCWACGVKELVGPGKTTEEDL